MSNDAITQIFADGIINVSHSNGVFRITFGQQEAEGKVHPNLKLMVPANQVAPMIQALTGAVNDIAHKIQETRDTKAKDAADKKPAAKTSKRKTTKSADK